jgi:hypothetical protein
METAQRTIRYLFVLALFLIAVAYFAGTKSLLQTGGQEAVAIGNTYTGRTQQGTFAAYPTGA